MKEQMHLLKKKQINHINTIYFFEIQTQTKAQKKLFKIDLKTNYKINSELNIIKKTTKKWNNPM